MYSAPTLQTTFDVAWFPSTPPSGGIDAVEVRRFPATPPDVLFHDFPEGSQIIELEPESPVSVHDARSASRGRKVECDAVRSTRRSLSEIYDRNTVSAPFAEVAEDSFFARRCRSLSPTGRQHVVPEEDCTPQTRDDGALGEGQYCVYIDRIAPDVSDRMLTKALNEGLIPCHEQKVVSLEVIRTQRSRHIHAFAILSSPLMETDSVEVALPRGEYVRVQPAAKQLVMPPPEVPCRTLHIRVFARRSGWVQYVNRMTWAGLLCILEMVKPGISEHISMVADDRSKRSNQSHQSVLLSVFFAECRSVADAILVHEAVHDMCTRAIDDVQFLVRADYSRGDKTLHDTSMQADTLKQQFMEAKKVAGNMYNDDSVAQLCNGEGDCPVPRTNGQTHGSMVHLAFEFRKNSTTAKKKKVNKKKKASPDETCSAVEDPWSVGRVSEDARLSRERSDDSDGPTAPRRQRSCSAERQRRQPTKRGTRGAR